MSESFIHLSGVWGIYRRETRVPAEMSKDIEWEIMGFRTREESMAKFGDILKGDTTQQLHEYECWGIWKWDGIVSNNLKDFILKVQAGWGGMREKVLILVCETMKEEAINLRLREHRRHVSIMGGAEAEHLGGAGRRKWYKPIIIKTY